MYLCGSLSLIIGTMETWRMTQCWQTTLVVAVLILTGYFMIWAAINYEKPTKKKQVYRISVENERVIDPMEMDRYNWDAEAARQARMDNIK